MPDELTRLRQEMIQVPFSEGNELRWMWIRPELVSVAEGPREYGYRYGYRWVCDGVRFDLNFYVGSDRTEDVEKWEDLNKMKLSEREELIKLVDSHWQRFYKRVVCGEY